MTIPKRESETDKLADIEYSKYLESAVQVQLTQRMLYRAGFKAGYEAGLVGDEVGEDGESRWVE